MGLLDGFCEVANVFIAPAIEVAEGLGELAGDAVEEIVGAVGEAADAAGSAMNEAKDAMNDLLDD